MPRIPEIGYSTRPVGPRQQPQMSAGQLAAPGAGMQQVGRTLQGAGGRLLDIQEKQAVFEAELQYAENEKRVREELEVAKREAPEGAEGFTEEAETRFDNWMPEALNQGPSMPAAQQLLREKYTRLRSAVAQEAMQFEARSRSERDTRRMAVVQDGLANEARTNPNNLDAILQKGEELVQGVPFWDEQQRGKMTTQLRQRVFNGSLDGWVTGYETTPSSEEEVDRAIQALKSGFRNYKGEVDSRVYDQALTRLENRKIAVAQESRVTLGKDLQDTLAAIETNGPAADPGFITEERLAKVYPDDPELRTRMLQQVNSAKNMYNIGQEAAWTTMDEDLATLEALKSNVKGRGAAFEKQNYLDHYRAVKNKWTAIGRDKVAYILQKNPSIAKDMQEIEAAIKANEPGAYEDFRLLLDRMDEQQAGLGIPRWRREFLGKGAANTVAEQLTGVGAEDAANIMEQLQGKYQDRWPQVMRELEAQNVDPRFMVLGMMYRPEDVSLRKTMAAAYQAGSAKLRSNIGENTTATDIDSKVAKQMTEFNATMQPAGRTGQETINRMTKAVQTLAYWLYQQGEYDSAGEASEEAFNRILGNRYDFGPTYRTPKGELGMVERATNRMLNTLRPEQFAPAAPGRDVEPEVYDSETGVAHRRQAAYSAAVRQGKWVNTPTGDGVMLFRQDDKKATGYSPVELEDGSNVVLRFEDIRNDVLPMIEPEGFGGERTAP